jgi:hypothetical protein
MVCLGNRGTYVFPLETRDSGTLTADSGRQANCFPSKLAGVRGIESCPTLLAYCYAVLHSPKYRTHFRRALQLGFPAVPTSTSTDAGELLIRLGSELVALHLMDVSTLETATTTFHGPETPTVGRVGWSDEAVWLDAGAVRSRGARHGEAGFVGVAEGVWNFEIGGHPVCQKWLKDRRGRELSADDIAHYQKIVVAISETIRIMAEIDEVIEEHGGWPDAFVTSGDGDG